MVTITPDTRVDMYSDIPISGDHQLFFKSKLEQTSYFNKHRNVTMASCSYINKTGRLRIEFNTARVQQCNYFSFKNGSFENVTFYARILDWEYVNNVTTDILYEIDYWQTFMFDVRYHACMIDREHLTQADYEKAIENPYRRDIPELLTDEGLPVNKELEAHYDIAPLSILGADGLRFAMPSFPLSSVDNTFDIVMYVSSFSIEDWDGTDGLSFLNCFDLINGQTTPQAIKDLKFASWEGNFVRGYAVMTIKAYGNETYIERMNRAINYLTIYGTTSSIIGIYVLPSWIGEGFGTDHKQTAEFNVKIKGISNDPIDGLNVKLKTNPFRYLRVESPSDTKEYNISLSKEAEENGLIFPFVFRICFNGQPSVSILPLNYKAAYQTRAGIEPNYAERIEFNQFPQVGYSCDAYLTYLSGVYSDMVKENTVGGNLRRSAQLTQDSLNLANHMNFGDILSLPSAVGNFGNVVDYMATSPAAFNMRGVSGNSYYDGTRRAFVNDKYVGGSNSGTLMYAFDDICFYVTLVTLEKDIAEKYSDYLNTYGYKSDRIKIPNVCSYIMDGTNEPHFETVHGDTLTYVKTQNAHVTGVMQVACSYIENMLNAGVRLIKGE